jgi:hypothetical protein
VLTTTVDGLWVLQAVTGIEQLCPELRLRPLIPRLETAQYALRHPMAAELRGLSPVPAIDEADEADPMIREWLTVIMRRDLALLVTINMPGREPTQASICRFASWWVVLERHGDVVRLSPAGTSRDEASASDVLVGQIERLLGVSEAAPLRPVTLDTKEVLAGVRDDVSLRSFLVAQRLEADQVQILTAVADSGRSSQASIVAIQAGAGPEKTARLAIGDAVVAIVDTPAGRVCMEHVDTRGHRYSVFSPATRSDIAGAVGRLIRRLPAGQDWYSYRRVV